MKKKILVTGSTGYIGRNIIEKLAEEYVIYSPNSYNLNLLDLPKLKFFFEENKIDVVIHCASSGVGRTEEGQSGVFEKNLRMFFNLILCAPLYNKLINFGSGAEYDKELEIKKIKEEDFGRSIPKMEYDFSKYVMGKYSEKSQENILHLRLFCVFGKYEDYGKRFISRSICRNLFRLPIEINQNAFFDYIYIDDIVEIVNYFIKNGNREKIYNVGFGQPIDLVSLAGIINEIADKKTDIIVKKQGLNKEYSCDNSKLFNEVRNLSLTSMRRGIKELYEYYKKNIDRIDLENIK